ncbi:hypothetical protein Tco_0779740 [Tanacetum coccineum]
MERSVKMIMRSAKMIMRSVTMTMRSSFGNYKSPSEHKTPFELLSEELEEKKFDIWYETLACDDSGFENGGSCDDSLDLKMEFCIEDQKIEVLFHEKLENHTTFIKQVNTESSESDNSVSKDGDWGIEDISELNVGIDEQIELESSQNESSELEGSTTCTENKEDSSS